MINFLEKNKPKSISSDLDGVKNNFFAHLFNMLRKIAKYNNIEKEFSKHITNLQIMPVHSILAKHSIDYYDYVDKIELLNKMHCEFNFLDEKMHYILNPKVILQSCSNFVELRTLWLSYYLFIHSEKKYNKKRLLEISKKINNYLDIFESFFSENFCKDHIQLCSDISNKINNNKKHRLNKNQRKKIKKQKELYIS